MADTKASTILLAQALARREEQKPQVGELLTKLKGTLDSSKVFTGSVKTYHPFADSPSDQGLSAITNAPEKTLVQARSWQLVTKLLEAIGDHWDVNATIEEGNTSAFTDVTLSDGTILLSHVPVTLLMWLEKQMTRLEEIVKSIPTLSSDKEWQWDTNENMFITKEPKLTVRTQSVPTPFVLAPATKEHPAQVQRLDVNKEVGHYRMTEKSGAIPPSTHEAMLARVREVKLAVHDALQKANTTLVEQKSIAKPLLAHILAPLSEIGN